MTKNKVKTALIAVLIIILILCGVRIISGYSHSEKQRVCIIQNGVILYQLDMSHETDKTIHIDGENGAFNIVEIKNQTICMKEANCPDKICVHTGVLRSENIPIVCLPNKLIIRFDEEK